MSACEELVGSPKYHVMTSHTIAPMSPQSKTQSRHGSAIRSMSTRSPPMVCATRVPNRAKATKLKNAAQATATPGESTRVETTVAIELAASCQPFATSKISATTMMSVINASAVVITTDARPCPITRRASHKQSLLLHFLLVVLSFLLYLLTQLDNPPQVTFRVSRGLYVKHFNLAEDGVINESLD